jgi:hypothetical protein
MFSMVLHVAMQFSRRAYSVDGVSELDGRQRDEP